MPIFIPLNLILLFFVHLNHIILKLICYQYLNPSTGLILIQYASDTDCALHYFRHAVTGEEMFVELFIVMFISRLTCLSSPFLQSLN